MRLFLLLNFCAAHAPQSLCAFLNSPMYKAHSIPHSTQQTYGSPSTDILGVVVRKQRKRWKCKSYIVVVQVNDALLME
jgi:hypothetical protein